MPSRRRRYRRKSKSRRRSYRRKSRFRRRRSRVGSVLRLRRHQTPLSYTLSTGGYYNVSLRASLDELSNYTEITNLFQYMKFTKIVHKITWINPSTGDGRTTNISSGGTTEAGTARGLNYPHMRVYRTPGYESFALTTDAIDELKNSKAFYMQPGRTYRVVSKFLEWPMEATETPAGTSTAELSRPAGWFNTAQYSMHVYGKSWHITSEQVHNANDPDFEIRVQKIVYFLVKGPK